MQIAAHNDYDWYMVHRLTIIRLLGVWGDQRAVPVLHHVLHVFWEYEKNAAFHDIPGWILRAWHRFEDELIHGLGQLEDWELLTDLEMSDLPPSAIHLARLYLILGSLHVNDLTIYHSQFFELTLRPQKRNPQLEALPAYQTFAALVGLQDCVDLKQIATVLQERFGFTEEQCTPYFYQLGEWYKERYTLK